MSVMGIFRHLGKPSPLSQMTGAPVMGTWHRLPRACTAYTAEPGRGSATQTALPVKVSVPEGGFYLQVGQPFGGGQ